MTSWRNVLLHAADDVESYFDELKYKFDDRFGRDPLKIIPYDGHGTPTTLWLRGRVLQDKGEQTATDRDGVWRNLVNMYRRFETDEIPGAQVRIRCAGATQDATTDDEGYFTVEFALPQPLPPDQLWHSVEYEVLQPDPAQATGQALVVPPDARFGVISDIDDTVLQTGATSLVQMARTVFLNNARTRLPFPGVAAFYQALHSGEAGDLNPIFYLSSSPWNLYDLLTDFQQLQGIPRGPLFLRDWGLSEEGFAPSRHHDHKLAKIENLLHRFPTLPFLLIGDSGQEDPEIYAEIVERFPQRIPAIYIRNINPSDERLEALRKLTEAVIAQGSALLVADDTVAMARHAAEHGWITEAALQRVAEDKAVNEQQPTDVESMLGETPDKQ